MQFNNPDRSELERRFELLFSQVFQCPWQEQLKAQYPVHTSGQTYFIDYVYEGHGEKIGLELDGRDKFFRFKQVFYNFFRRQNALQLAGIRIYRFTWGDVVDQGGWRAHQQLHQIFKGRILTPLEHVGADPHSTKATPQRFPMVLSTLSRLAGRQSSIPQESTTLTQVITAPPASGKSVYHSYKPSHPQSVSLETIDTYQAWPSRGKEQQGHSHTAYYSSNSPSSSWPSRLTGSDYQPGPPFRRRFSLRDGLLILLGIGMVTLWFKTQHSPEAQQASKAPVPISELAPASKMPLRIDQPSLGSQSSPQIKSRQIIQPVPKVVTQTVYVPAPHAVNKPSPSSSLEPKTSQAESNTAGHSILPPQLQTSEPLPIPKEPVAEPINSTFSPQATSEPDEIVAFNRDSGIFHKPNSYWARKCTRNCIYIPKSQAIQMGGRASRSDR